jgi:hypothetical protein
MMKLFVFYGSYAKLKLINFYRDESIHALIEFFGIAPIFVATGFPFLKIIYVGTLLIPYFAAAA